MAYTIAVAGSTTRTAQCLAALAVDPRFSITWVLTPEPRATGRQQRITPNPVHQFAQEHSLTSIQLHSKIDAQIKEKILSPEMVQPDFLLVVDFGYLVPEWLLALPKKAPLNLHPSLLPRWRGSSPGQFVLLWGDDTSAVTLMIMNQALDEGAILHQESFAVNPAWRQNEYYAASFKLATAFLGSKIAEFAEGKITPQPQPTATPTPIARRLNKEDSFIEWNVLQASIEGKQSESLSVTSELLRAANQRHQNWAVTLSQACKAFYPWPGLWTVIPTNKGQLRLKILSCQAQGEQLTLDQVQLEGKTTTNWSVVARILEKTT
ncbi:MAG: hypothetical protein M3Q81_00495 [bacterium]|nr:hypothetical protein [bacterium]